MPDARPLGNAASAITEWINDQNMLDVLDFQTIIGLAAAGDITGIIDVAKHGAGRNLREFQVGTYMVSGFFDKAQDKMIDGVIAKRKQAADTTSVAS